MAILEANTQQANRGRSSKVKGGEMVLASTKTNTKKQALHNVSVKSESCYKRKRSTVVNDGVKSKAMMRAIEIQASLSSKFPSLIKYMLPSHVSGGFWLGLWKKFCDEHLPRLSGGWRGFSVDHNLVEGDVLVFHLVKPTRFKVYVVRANSSEEVDGALALLKFDSSVKQMNPYHAPLVEAEMEYQDLEYLYLNNPEENNTMPGISNARLVSDHSENESEDFGFEITDGIRMSETVIDFKEVSSFRGFRHPSKWFELPRSLPPTIILTTWEKTLKAFLGLGMKVDFLLARLERLVNLSLKSEKHKKARLEKDNAEEGMRILEKDNAENLELRFQELAKAPW
ncbi:hypothetical protein OIU76_027164 [Salix suchowensis]|nr:hypothetical protein OIU76_027164 [Salix suchowensis]